ncbi:hypothetical protein [Chitinophaga sp. sic0106]|uniref:hypothetical protein n=1 Tax=Chitinophaga sp. sic0106 TaxID=2854785 RepID=UPI001C47EA21|nr:hypothetical protein [Chitinophaga sp. sic0106]MBV7533780.1 hypothetical protein [Chitinophaga sp. sic0106]
MSNVDNSYYINSCLLAVCSTLGRGDFITWTNYDYEKLSVDIEEKTGVLLSVTTLKRVFGRVKYNSAPAITTLNALAQYIGFADWQGFRLSQAAPAAEVPVPAPVRHLQWRWWALGLLAVLLVTIAWIGRPGGGRAGSRDSSAYQFSSTKVLTAGVPNSVVFNYDANAAGDDSVFIAQSWDVSRRKAVDKRTSAYSSIYYYPGFFRARLLIGNDEVRYHDLIINSDGWLAVQAQEEVPVYFKKAEYEKDSQIIVSKGLLEKYKISLQPQLPAVRMYNVQRMPGLRGDNFTFETSLRSDFNEGSGACQRIDVLVLCENDVIIVPLSAKGCIGDLSLVAGGASVSSIVGDLSGFGCDPRQWVDLKITSGGGVFSFYVNGRLAYTLKAQNMPSAIVGVQYRFAGPAALRKAVFTTGERQFKLL